MITISDFELFEVDKSFVPYQRRVDVNSGTATYYGVAVAGAASSGSAWRIARLETTGSANVLRWATLSGTATYGGFDKVWDNRILYTYG